MLKIALITNFNIAEKANAAMQVAKRLMRWDCELLVASFHREKLQKYHKSLEGFHFMPMESVYSQADILVVFGGDGTILEAARIAGAEARADAYVLKVLPAMEKLRAYVDEMEMLTAEEYWPLPSYGDMMFNI